jgi:hypothetical protein
LHACRSTLEDPRSQRGFAVVAEGEGVAIAPKQAHIWKRAAEILMARAENLGRAAAVGRATLRVFDGIHKGEAFAQCRQRQPQIPALKKAAVRACPVIAAVGSLQTH